MAVKTLRCTYYDSLGKSNRRLVSYFFTFDSDRRSFASEEQRRSFMARSFSELRLDEIPENKRQWNRTISPLERVCQALVGRRLSAVSFVMDYLQLDFPPYGFYVYNWPRLLLERRILGVEDHGYRDVLQELIGKKVSSVDDYLDTGLTIDFADGARLAVPIKVGDDFPCPEVAEFHGPGFSGMVWQANEPPFD